MLYTIDVLQRCCYISQRPTLKMPPSGEAPKPITETCMPVFPNRRFGMVSCVAAIDKSFFRFLDLVPRMR